MSDITHIPMDTTLIIEKCRRALAKRSKHQPQKTLQAWIDKGYINEPTVSFVVQSHNASTGVKRTVDRLRQWPKAEIIVIDDGSERRHTDVLTKYLTGTNEFLLHANDLYENVMYDKAIRLSNGRYCVLLQDDDDIGNLHWLERGLALFAQHPRMAILGGFGCQDIMLDHQARRTRGVPYSKELGGGANFISRR